MARSGGRSIALVRERRRWTQQQLADQWGVNKSRVNRIEKGKSPLNLATLDSLLPVLGIGPEQYFRLVVLFETADEELAKYPAAEQGNLPFEVREASGAREPALGGWDDPDVAAAQGKASGALDELRRKIDSMDVRRALREERAKARPERAARPRRRRGRQRS
ncbi:MAG: helix-turn-helix domain-containing protein [Thermoanaerobaculia bacterium]